MRATFLGTGSAINSDSIGSSLMIGDRVLIDAPGGIPTAMRQFSFDPHTLEVILITHLHGDHTFGLPFVLLEFMLKPRSASLPVYGPSGLSELVTVLTQTAFPEAEATDLLKHADPAYNTVSDGFRFNAQDMAIAASRVPHGGIETYAYTITANSRSLLYAPDMEFGDHLNSLLEHVDIAVLDATTLSDPIPSHMTFEQILSLASIHPTVLFYTTHRGRFTTRDIELPANVLVPAPGAVIDPL